MLIFSHIHHTMSFTEWPFSIDKQKSIAIEELDVSLTFYEKQWDLISILFAAVPISFIRISRPAASNESVRSRPTPSIFSLIYHHSA